MCMIQAHYLLAALTFNYSACSAPAIIHEVLAVPLHLEEIHLVDHSAVADEGFEACVVAHNDVPVIRHEAAQRCQLQDAIRERGVLVLS